MQRLILLKEIIALRKPWSLEEDAAFPLRSHTHFAYDELQRICVFGREWGSELNVKLLKLDEHLT